MFRYTISLLVFFVSLFFSLALSPEEIYLNSDILYIPTVVLDLFRDGGNFLSWSYTPSPYFFPDFPAIGLLFLLFGNAQKALLCFAFLQTILFAVLMERFWIYTREERKRKKLTGPESQMVKSWVLLLTSFLLLGARQFPALYILFLPSIHASAFLVCLYIWPLIHRKLENRQIGILFFWILLTTAADRILFAELVLPAVFSGFLYPSKENSGWKRFFPQSSKIVLGAGAAGLILHSILKSFLYIERPGKIPTLVSLHRATEDGNRFFTEASLWIRSGLRETIPVPAILLCVFAIALVFSLGRIRKTRSTSFLFFFFVILFFLPIANGAYIDEYSIRYAAPALILGPFFLLFVAGFPKRNLTLAIFLLFLLLLKTAQKLPEKPENAILRLALSIPQEAVCLDKISEKEPISLVVADFWTAKRIRVFSEHKIPAIHVAYGTLEGSHTISNRDWYLKDYFGSVAVATHGLDEGRILDVYGVPTQKHHCETTNVWIYHDPVKILEALKRPFQKTK
ncbi:hypothetical protein AB3N59_18220 [Leptospira sp. WS92.C1]